MSDISKSAFEQTIVQLLTASPKNSSKGDPMKDWFSKSFNVYARVARITEDKQLGNRITEQFSYKDAVVVFVLEPGVNCDSLVRKVKERQYAELSAVLIVVAHGTEPPYSYEKLLTRSHSAVTKWLSDELGVEEEMMASVSGTVAMPSEDNKYLAAIRTKPFVLLAGISGTGKSRMVRELARGCCPRHAAGTTNDHPLYDEQKPGNFESIAVRPNWHDSTELLGYVSRISGHDEYQVTDFVKFLCKAWRYEQEGIPFFLCLDEMNLAPVEQYFAEYLSVIESRQHVDGKIVTDPLVRFKNDDILKQVIDEVYADGNLSGTDSEKAQLRMNYFGKFKKAGGIPIPSNLVVMGTVNMDETTFSFSRKVLDRAMSFELNEVAMGGGLDRNPDVAFGSIPEGAAKQGLVKGFEAYAESAASREICDKVVAYLTEVNRLLDGTPFKIAYRTRDEAMIYCIERCRGGEAGGVSLPTALDEISSMKILSRIEGDSLRLAARDVFTPPADTAQTNLLGQLKALILAELKKLDPDATEERYPVCARKLDGMSERLKGGFTGFWQ